MRRLPLHLTWSNRKEGWFKVLIFVKHTSVQENDLQMGVEEKHQKRRVYLHEQQGGGEERLRPQEKDKIHSKE